MPKIAKKSKESVAAFLLLDRSGSMSSLWDEALGAVNGYVATLAKDLPKAAVTLAVFDGGDSFEVIRDAVVAGGWKPVTSNDATPRGMTPLYDAVVTLCGRANAASSDKTTLVVMTDGAENASKEATREAAKIALDAARAKGWDVLFLGANWDAMGQSATVGTAAGHTLNMAKGNISASMTGLATRTAAYSTGALSASAHLSDADRKRAGWKAPA